MLRKPIVGVLGAGDRCSTRDRDLALELGERIAGEGWILLTGGRDAGVMAAANEGAKRVEESLTVGILPDSDARDSSPYVDVPVLTALGSGRNNVIALTCDVVVACGAGGPGTASEIALAIKGGTPVVLLSLEQNAQQYFSSLGGARVTLADTAGEAVAGVRALLATLRR